MNDFFLYRLDFPTRYPDVNALLSQTPQHRSWTMAAMWHGESNEIRQYYMDQYVVSRSYRLASRVLTESGWLLLIDITTPERRKGYGHVKSL